MSATSRTSLEHPWLVKAVLLASWLLWAPSVSAHGGAGSHVHPEEWAAVAMLGAPLGLALVQRLVKDWRRWQAGRP